MLPKSQQLLLVVGLCLFVASSADVDCSKRHKHFNPRSCCTVPDFISDELKEKCQQYDIKPPGPPPMSAEQGGEERHHHPHHWNFPPPCYLSCVINETGIYEDNKLDEGILKDYLEIIYKDDEDLQTALSNAFVTCADKMDEFKDKMGNRPRPPPPPGLPACPHTTSFLMGCVFKNVFMNCPASFWNDTQECNDSIAFIEKCKPPKRFPSSGEKPEA